MLGALTQTGILHLTTASTDWLSIHRTISLLAETSAILEAPRCQISRSWPAPERVSRTHAGITQSTTRSTPYLLTVAIRSTSAANLWRSTTFKETTSRGLQAMTRGRWTLGILRPTVTFTPLPRTA